MERRIFHVDVNSAFLSWEAARRVARGEADLRLVPSAIGGDRDKRTGVILAKSIPAKAFHVTTGEPVAAALQKCPQLVLAKPDFHLYKACSRAFMEICSRYAPVVEKFSIDECFLDMTGTDRMYPDPLAVAYALVTMDACTLFIAPGRLSDADAATLAESGVALRGYNELIDAVHALPAEEVFLVDEKATNYALYEALTAHKTVAGADPIFALKGIKNEVELKNIRECHIRDGIAVVRFQMDLEKALAEGKTLTEIDIDTMLQKRRAEMPGYFEDSFSTIAAYGTNAAMMHYHAEGDVNSVIEPHGFLLVDNGGQYDCGTTDITRTYPVGPLTDNERRYYTWVLQSHIDMARAVFLDYCTGFALDTFARGPVWAHKVNYRCGTGHGVGFISGVHEGPQSLRPNNPIIFKPGMTITDEPGIYETDEVGIRIENELECVDLGDNQYGHWLGFAPLTLVPIATEPVLVDELSRDQINWLNDYHAHVYEMLSPRLHEDEKVWLKEKCAPIGR